MNTYTGIGRLIQINVSPRGGVPKLPVPSASVTRLGIMGDAQRDRENHGGPARAVSLYSLERIEALRAEGHPISPGSTGENLTIAGLDWERLQPGHRLRIGEWVELELTDYVVPCSTIAKSFLGGRVARISQRLHPGWSRLYARVISEGDIAAGDLVEHAW